RRDSDLGRQLDLEQHQRRRRRGDPDGRRLRALLDLAAALALVVGRRVLGLGTRAVRRGRRRRQAPHVPPGATAHDLRRRRAAASVRNRSDETEGGPMANELQGKRIAFIATEGVEEAELTEPWKAVE